MTRRSEIKEWRWMNGYTTPSHVFREERVDVHVLSNPRGTGFPSMDTLKKLSEAVGDNSADAVHYIITSVRQRVSTFKHTALVGLPKARL